MKFLLASVMLVDEHEVDPDKVVDNLVCLGTWNLHPVSDVERKVHGFVLVHFREHAEPPSISGLLAEFSESDRAVVDYLETLRKIDPLVGSSFRAHVKKVFEREQESTALRVFKEAIRITSNETEIELDNGKKVRKQGLREAVSHVYEAMSRLTMTDSGVKLSGDSIADAQDIVDAYYLTKGDPSYGIGRLTGIWEVDKFTRGVKKGEVWAHCGSAGHLKTSFALCWSWRQAVLYRNNVYYLSLEMPKEVLDRRIFVLHSTHPKFAEMGLEPLPYVGVRDGKLTPEQEVVLEVVKDDLVKGAATGEYGWVWVERPPNAVKVSDLRQMCESRHRIDPVGMIVVDRVDLLESRYPSSRMTESQNWIWRDAHELALNFNNAEGVPVVLLAQMNREGLDYANANDGLYTVKHIAWANEAERSSDVITYSYLRPRGYRTDDLDRAARAQGVNPEVFKNDWKSGCLKNRDNPIFNQFTGHVDWDTRLMTSARGPDQETFSKSWKEAHSFVVKGL